MSSHIDLFFKNFGGEMLIQRLEKQWRYSEDSIGPVQKINGACLHQLTYLIGQPVHFSCCSYPPTGLSSEIKSIEITDQVFRIC